MKILKITKGIMDRFALKILFPYSRSKYFGRVLKLAREFEHFKPGKLNEVSIEREEELVEKWEFFNLLFWRVVDWKGSAVEFDGQRYRSHCDKTMVFYQLQQKNNVRMSAVMSHLQELRRIYDYTFISAQKCQLILN